MDLNELPGGIPSRISGLLFAVLRHLLALSELAAEETRLLIRQSILTILMLAAFLVTVVICYLALLAAIISILALGQEWGWPSAFAVVAFAHLLLAGLILFLIRKCTTPHLYEATASELRRDLDALASYAGKSSRTPQ